MRVGIDARELAGRPTGVGRYLRSLLRRWPAPGDELFLYFNGPAPAGLPSSPARLVVRASGRASRGLFWQELELPRLARPDRLGVFFSPAYACPLRLELPRVTTVHDVSYFHFPQDFAPAEAARRRLLVGASLAASARVLTISEFSRRELLAVDPGLAPRLRVTPLAADEDLPQGAPRAEARARLGQSGPLLLSVGSIFNRRRLPELLRAVARLAPRCPGLRLCVVGDNRTQPRLDLAALARELGLAGRVALEGFVTDAELADRYAAADVAVFLSEYEGFGLPALEAAARGVPLVVSDRPALSEVFGAAALTVDPGDVDAIAAALGRVLGDAALRQGLVSRGRALAAGHSWNDVAVRTRAALAEVAA